MTRLRFFLLLASALACTGSAFGDAALMKRMKDRLPKLLAAKGAGSIGEGADGLAHLRPGADADASKLVAAENADRIAFFALAARKAGGSASAVAKQWAKAMRAKGKSGHWFRDAKGAWSRK